jgi:hypothetical protein
MLFFRRIYSVGCPGRDKQDNSPGVIFFAFGGNTATLSSMPDDFVSHVNALPVGIGMREEK